MDTLDPPSFVTGDGNEPSLLWYMLQQLGVPTVAFLVLLVSPGLPWFFVKSGMIGRAIEFFRLLAVSAIIGFILGLVTLRLAPGARSTGKWIWVLPTLILLCGFFWDSLAFSPGKAFSEVFFPGPDGDGWFVFILVTCPTVSTAAYSSTLTLRRAGQ